MLFANGLVGLLLLALWVFVIFDVISTDSSLCRNLPKILWLVLVVLVPVVGSVAWMALGRPVKAGWRAGDTKRGPVRRPLGPEDSPEFLSRSEELNRRLEAWEAEQRRREEKLKSRELELREAELRRREEELRRREQGETGSEGA